MGNNLPFGLNQCSQCRMCYANETDLRKLAREHHDINERCDSDQYTESDSVSVSDSTQETMHTIPRECQTDAKNMTLFSTMTPVDATISPNTDAIRNDPTTPTEHILSSSTPHTPSELITDMSTVRVKKLSEILDPIELQQAIKTNYDPETPFSVEAEESPLDDDEIQEIERRKSETKQNKRRNSEIQLIGPQLCKTDSDKPMQQEDMNTLKLEMEQQLVSLQNGNIYKDGYEAKVKLTSLFRPKSAYKWDKDALEEQHKQMQKELMHLMMDNAGNVPK